MSPLSRLWRCLVVGRVSVLASLAVVSALTVYAPVTREAPPVAHAGATASRAVASERGLRWGAPYDGNWSNVGAYIGGSYRYDVPWSWLPPESVKAAFVQFTHVAEDGTAEVWPHISHRRVAELDAQERTAGRAPVLMTGTLNGVSRPLYFNWSVGYVGDGQSPTSPPSTWKQGINVTSPAYMDYFVNEVLKPYAYTTRYSNWYVAFDECNFKRRLYGVVENNVYRMPTRWNAPFPQSEAEYLQAVKTFFSGLKQRVPGLKLLCNDGGQDTFSELTSLYQDLDGAFQEDLVYFLDWSWDGYARDQFALRLQTMKWLADQGKVHLECFDLKGGGDLEQQARTAYAMYALTRGDSTFFCPQTEMRAGDSAFPELPASYYAGMQQALGAPAGAYEALATGGQGYYLYSRRMQGGLIYFNYTGQNRTVQLPAGASYQDRAGNAVTSLWLPNLTGDYVTYAAGAPAPPPPGGGGSGAPTILNSGSQVRLGQSLRAVWDIPEGWGTPPTTTDWVGLFRTGSPDSGVGVGWVYTSSCTRSPAAVPDRTGTCQIMVPRTAVPGSYELRLYSRDGWSRLATSQQTINVVP